MNKQKKQKASLAEEQCMSKPKVEIHGTIVWCVLVSGRLKHIP